MLKSLIVATLSSAVILIPAGYVTQDGRIASDNVVQASGTPPTALLEKVAVDPIPVRNSSPALSVQVRGTSGNGYYEKQCVWWAYERRKEMGIPVPGNWSDANKWLGNARAMGWPTGSEPRVGAVGARGNHVVVIERVNGDGTVYLSEMNYDYRGGFRYRTAPASDFLYIY